MNISLSVYIQHLQENPQNLLNLKILYNLSD